MTDDKLPNWISGFWRRLGALLIDSLVLGIAGFSLVFLFKSPLQAMGNWAWLVGFAVSLLYFGLMDSQLGSGQTIGKWLLGIQVVDVSGRFLNFPRALLRSLVFITPFMLNGRISIQSLHPGFWGLLLSVLVLGGMAAIVYLAIFNRVTRQSLHDLAAGSYVTRVRVEPRPPGAVWKPHFAVVAVLFLLVIVGDIVLRHLTHEHPFKEMLAARQALLEQSEVRRVTSITSGTTHFWRSGQTKTTIQGISVIAVIKPGNEGSDDRLARRLARIVMAKIPESRQQDYVRIWLVRGLDIGIWSEWHRSPHDYKPLELEKKAAASL